MGTWREVLMKLHAAVFTWWWEITVKEGGCWGQIKEVEYANRDWYWILHIDLANNDWSWSALMSGYKQTSGQSNRRRKSRAAPPSKILYLEVSTRKEALKINVLFCPLPSICRRINCHQRAIDKIPLPRWVSTKAKRKEEGCCISPKKNV